MNPLELTYWDNCSIYELERTKVKSITQQEWVLKHENIKCALSATKQPRSAQTESENQIIADYTLFINDSVEVKAGSKIVCNGHDLRAGKPLVYKGSHQEIPCYFEERA